MSQQRWKKPVVGWSPRIYIRLFFSAKTFFFCEDIFFPRDFFFVRGLLLVLKPLFLVKMHILMLLSFQPKTYILQIFSWQLTVISPEFSLQNPRGLNFFPGKLDFSVINRFLGGLLEARRLGLFHRWVTVGRFLFGTQFGMYPLVLPVH